MIAVAPFLEVVCKPLFDGLPTPDWSFVRDKSRVLREERGQGGGIVVVFCLVPLLMERDKLLTVLLTEGRCCLLGKDRQSRADC